MHLNIYIYICLSNYVEKHKIGCKILTTEADEITIALSTLLKAHIRESQRSSVSSLQKTIK